jgi:hypothetical protein
VAEKARWMIWKCDAFKVFLLHRTKQFEPNAAPLPDIFQMLHFDFSGSGVEHLCFQALARAIAAIQLLLVGWPQ